jgi:hypothetical protein
VAALRATAPPEVAIEGGTAVLKLWARRYRDLARLRTQVMCRLHAVLCDLVPGGFSREISAGQAIDVLHRLTVHGPVADARLELAHDLVTDLRRIDPQRREVNRIEQSLTILLTDCPVNPLHRSQGVRQKHHRLAGLSRIGRSWYQSTTSAAEPDGLQSTHHASGRVPLPNYVGESWGIG